MTKKITKLVILFAMIALVILVSLNLTSGADDIEIATSVELEKYINYQLSDNDKGTLVQYNIKLGMEYLGEYNDFPIKESEIAVNLNQIDGKYPSGVKVITKGTQATNGKNRDMTENYSYDTNSGNLVIKASNENENGDKIYNQAPNSNAKDEYLVICYYDTYTAENPEREVSCNVSAKTVLFENNRELNSNQEFSNKVTQNTSELTSASIRTSEIYNGQIKSNIINGTQTGTEYKEIEQIVVSKKEEQQKIEISQNDTLVNNEKEIGNNKNILYKSTKVKKDNLLKLLGEDGNIQIFDANSNLVATINKDSEWEEDGSLTINYDSGLENIKVKTSQIQSEGILELYNSKEISNTMKDINNNKIKSNMTIKGINETRTQEEITNEETGEKTTQEKIVEEQAYERNNQNDIEIKDSTTDVTVNINNTNWTNKQQNEITFDIYLNSNSSKNNMFNNPTVRVNLPAEVEKVILNKSSIVYANGLELQDPYIETNKDGTLSIVANLTGVQSNYMDSSLGLMTDVQIQATIILKKDVENKTSNIQCVYTNKFTLDNSVEEGNITKEISLENYKEENTQPITQEGVIYDSATTLATADNSNIDKLKVEVSPVKGDTVIKDGDTVYEGEYIKYNIKVTNTADTAIDNIKVVGGVPDGTTYGELEADYFTYQGKYEYNFDENIKEKTINIGSLKAGESVEKFYEVRVNDLQEEDEKQIQTSIKAYVEQTEASKYELTNMVKTAEAKIFVDAKLDEGVGIDRWNYGVTINGEQGKEVIVTMKFPSEFKLEKIVHKGQLHDISEGFISISNDNVATIKLKLDEDKDYSFAGTMDSSTIDKNNDVAEKILCTIAMVKLDNNIYISNENRITYLYPNVTVTMTSPNEGEEVKYGEKIEYNITLKNIGGANLHSESSYINVHVSDFLPKGIQPISLIYETYEESEEITGEYWTSNKFTKREVEENISYTVTDKDGNILPNVDIDCTIPYKESINIKIVAKADMVYEKIKAKNTITITSEETESVNDEEVTRSVIGTKQSNIVTHTILPYNYSENGKPDNPTNPDSPDDPVKPDTKKYTILGIAWVDENKDGQRQTNEKLLENVEVLLINAENSKVVSEGIRTDSSGAYRFSDLEVGRYIVVFKYDESKYRLTEYKKVEVSDDTNSDAIKKEIDLNGERLNVAATDIISLDTSSLNIDIGLIENEICDLKLDKYISKVSVTTKSGTREYNYSNNKLAKAEIRAKEIEGATVIVEYKLVITNEGELPTSVTRLVDYIPNGLNFSSELNKNWSLMQNGKLVNTSFTNQKIEPGEALEVSLILNKRMSSNATGTYTNIAEIDAISNELGIQDVDSTPGNKVETEDDYSKADLIISIGTGLLKYISIAMIIGVFVGCFIVVMMKNKKIRKTMKIFMFLFVFIGTIYMQAGTSKAIKIISNDKLDLKNKKTYAAPQKATFKFDGATYEAGGGSYFTGGPNKNGLRDIGGWCLHHGIPNQDIDGQYFNYTLKKATYKKNTSGKTDIEKVTFITKHKDSDPLSWQNDNSSNYIILGEFWQNLNGADDGDVEVKVYDKNGNEIKNVTILQYNDNDVLEAVNEQELMDTETFYLKFKRDSLKNGISKVVLNHTVDCESEQTISVTVSATYNPDRSGNYQPVGCKWKVKGKQKDTKTKTSSVVWDSIPEPYGSLEIKKVDSGNQNITLAGVKIKVTGPNNYDSRILTSDNNGNFTKLDNLVPGIYTLQEISNPNYGYTKMVTENVTVESGIATTHMMKNEKQTGNLYIHKQDAKTGKALKQIGFKIKNGNGQYLKFNNITGRVNDGITVSSIQVATNNSDATEFYTDNNGDIKIYNILRGSYFAEETTINNSDYYGYELDPDYISWNDYDGHGTNGHNCRWTSQGQGTLKGTWAYVWVETKQTSSMTCYNEKKYTKLSGYVWVDKINTGKKSERNDYYKKDSQDDADKSAEVPVYLKDKNGGIVSCRRLIYNYNNNPSIINYNQNTSSEYANTLFKTRELGLYDEIDGGEYKFIDVLIRELENYHVEFEYDGLTYTNVIAHPNEDNGSKAIEKNIERQDLNQKFSTISNNVAISNDQKNLDIPYNKNTTTKDEYGKDIQASIFNHTEFDRINNNVDKIKAYTNEVDANLLKNKHSYDSDEVKYINLGLYEREQPNYSLDEDLYSVKVSVNGDSHIYKYDKNTINERVEKDNNKLSVDENGYKVGVQFERDKEGSYYRAIYKSDLAYKNTEDTSKNLQVYLTYRITIQNMSTNLTAKIINIANYYDKRYYSTPENIKISKNVCEIDPNTKQEGNYGDKQYSIKEADENGNNCMLKISLSSSYNEQYNKMIIDTNELEVAPLSSQSIYVQFRILENQIYNIYKSQDEGGILKNISEINSYATLYKNVEYAGIDKNSNPGNANIENITIGDRSTYEDDTAAAPTLKLTETQEERKITGNIFEDTVVGSTGETLSQDEKDAVMSGKYRQGNGIFDDGEKVISDNVKVRLMKKNGEVAKIWNLKDDGSGESTDAEKVSEGERKDIINGAYEFTGILPDEYYVQFEWGDQTYTVQNYKSTIVDRAAYEAKTSGNSPYWYKDEFKQQNGEWNNNSEIRKSDAVDDSNIRGNIDKQMQYVTNSNQSALGSAYDSETQQVKNKEGTRENIITRMNSNTPQFKVRVEYENGDSDYSSKYSEEEFYTANGQLYSEITNHISSIDFGIVRRAKQQITLEKDISAMKVTLANGQVIADFTIEEDNNGNKVIKGERKHTVYIGPLKNVAQKNGLVKFEIDNELLQGTKIEVEYKITAKNTSEVDYQTDDFYKYGKGYGEDIDKIIKITPSKIIDYLDKGWGYDSNQNVDEEGNNIWTVNAEISDELKQYLSEAEKIKNNGNLMILTTDKLSDIPLSPLEKDGVISSNDITLKASKILSTTEEIALNNDSETIVLNKTGGSKLESTPGDYVPRSGPHADTDDDMAEEVIVTPSTGKNLEYIVPITTGVVALAILGAGIILIKKKVLKKDKK